MISTAVAFLIFNRPKLTERVFQEIARTRPRRLLVIADGPRRDREGEAEKCSETRAIVDRVDWDCEVLKNYSDVNLGCARRVATGLHWVFEQVEEAIVLEDDCLPHPTFFPYCEDLLAKYRNDKRVMHITGTNLTCGPQRTPYSYFFSWYPSSWGWASWRRAWRHYDGDLKLWPALRDTPWLLDILGDREAAEFWRQKFDQYTSGLDKADTWDFQWLFACWAHRGFSILPRTNLISNIGFTAEATHTKYSDVRADVSTVEMTFPLAHPPCMVRDIGADRTIVEQAGFQREPQSLYWKVRRRCLSALPRPLRRSLAAVRTTLLSQALRRRAT
jgi:hypothetical protein